MPMETSHIWLGVFNSEEHLDKYFEEQYQEEHSSINQFAADQGEAYYDHDWVERVFGNSGDLRELIHGASYAQDYLQEVIVAAAARGIESANTFVLADCNEFASPKTVEAGDYRLWYIGDFKRHI